MNVETLAGLVPDSTYVDVKDVPWQPRQTACSVRRRRRPEK